MCLSFHAFITSVFLDRHKTQKSDRSSARKRLVFDDSIDKVGCFTLDWFSVRPALESADAV